MSHARVLQFCAAKVQGSPEPTLPAQIMKAIIAVLLLFISIISPAKVFSQDTGLKLGSFDLTPSPSDPQPTVPVGSTPKTPPERDQPNGLCTAGGRGVAASALFLYYRRLGMPVGQAQQLAEQRISEYMEAANRTFVGQPCIETVVKALVRVAIARGVDFYDLLNQYSSMTTYEIMQQMPKESSTPLFLWSPKPLVVRIQSGAVILRSNPESINQGWMVKVDKQGKLTDTYTGKVYEAIDYDVSPVFLPLPPPERIYINVSKLDEILRSILDTSKISAIFKDKALSSWKAKIPDAPYYEIGVYLDEDAGKLLPLTFIPQPDKVARLVLFVKPTLKKSVLNNEALILPDLSLDSNSTAIDVGMVLSW